MKDYETKKELTAVEFNSFVKEAPIVIVGCADIDSFPTGKWAIVDTTFAMENMVIAAWSLGIGSCWIDRFEEKKTKEMLKIPDAWKIVALLILGYSEEQTEQQKRKPVEELFSFNRFSPSLCTP